MSGRSTILHELAGLISGIWSFSEIIESRPDHPERESFISLVRLESKKAAQAMRDLQLLSALESDQLRSEPGPVWLHELIAASASNCENPALFEDLAAELEADAKPVVADPALLSDILVRIADLSAERAAVPSVRATTSGGKIDLRVGCGAAPRGTLEAGVRRGEGVLRVFYIARLLTEAWGGAVAAEETPIGDDAGGDVDAVAVLSLQQFAPG